MITPDEILNARFQATKFREGYDQDEVDDFLDRVVRTLRARTAGAPDPTALSSADIAATHFRVTKFREGYDQAQVDSLLDRVMDALSSPVEPQHPGVAAPAPMGYPDSRGTSTPPGMVDVRRGGLLGLLRRR